MKNNLTESVSLKDLEYEMRNIGATKKQLWALFCIYQKDFRTLNLKLKEAGEIISLSKNNTPLSFEEIVEKYSLKINSNEVKTNEVKTNEVKTNEVKIKKDKPKEPSLEEFMLSKIDVLKKTLIGEFDITSIVKNDTNFVKDDGKRFILLGGGCGFSHISYDKRSKKAGIILEQASKIRKKIEKEVIKAIGVETIKYLESIGNPIQAHMYQNLQYNSRYNGLIVQYMESKGIKNVTIKNNYD